MPIDPSIPLGVVPPKFNTPFENLSQVLQIRNLQQEQQVRQAQMADVQAQAAERRQKVQQDQAAAQREAQWRGVIQHAIDPTDGTFQIENLVGPLIAADPEKAASTIPTLIGMNKAITDSRLEPEARHKVAVAQAGIAINHLVDASGGQPLDPDNLKLFLSPFLQVKDPKTNQPVLAGDELAQVSAVLDSGDQPKIKQLALAMAQSDPGTYSKYLGEQKTAAETANQQAEAAHRNQPPAKAPPEVGTFGDYLTRTVGPNPSPAQILQARKAYGQADNASQPTSGTNDAGAIADAIVSGDQPPTIQGLYRMAAPVRAELARRGYDFTKANLDWEATKKHLSTLNGAQQTRLRQAIGTASESLGVIEDLAKQWDGGKFPLLNKATLAVAKQGGLGPQAQQLATNLEAQITDVTSELGNVYMGGNSPTDHALGLAQQNLSANWTRDQLLSAIKLARTNLQIRQNSIQNAGAVTTDSPPAAAPATAAPTLGLTYQDYLKAKGGK